ncbi:uracil DNA glycosylase [Tulasnella sp. JGI-2019a]|nr:uracil DNA glycosylase [Tulasnella sp. JGI-2019a]
MSSPHSEEVKRSEREVPVDTAPSTAILPEAAAAKESTSSEVVAQATTVTEEPAAVYEEDLVVKTGTLKKTSSKVLSKRPASPSGSEPANKRAKGTGTGTLDGFFQKKPNDERSSSPAGPSNGGAPKDPIVELEKRTLGIDWREALRQEFSKAYFVKLKTFIQSEYKSQTVYPVAKDVYSWSRLTKLEAVKVVIIGQDPYHGPGQAHGLSFSVRDPVPPPPSLKNIYKQLADDIPGFKIPKSGDLSATARQGVLWLNTSLTVRASQAGSHSNKGWETFTAAVLKAVIGRKSKKGVVFLAWGSHASKVCKNLNIDRKKHLVLESAHPSPLSAHRGFLGNNHFRKTNEWLNETHGDGSEIDWTVLNPE